MTEGLESGTDGAAPKDPKTFECRWSNCKKDHTVDIDPDYPEGGKTTKTTSGDEYYRTLWMNGRLLPWELTGGLPRTRYRVPDKSKPHEVYAYAAMQNDYSVQGHHLIPDSCFNSGMSDLINNIELIGWDIDRNENGYFLPKYDQDQPIHQLPKHDGDHGGCYKDPIREQLIDMQDYFDGICDCDVTGDLQPQRALIAYLDQLAELALNKLMAVRTPGRDCWPLYSRSRQMYLEAMAEYQRRERYYRKNPLGDLHSS